MARDDLDFGRGAELVEEVDPAQPESAPWYTFHAQREGTNMASMLGVLPLRSTAVAARIRPSKFQNGVV